MLFQSVNHEFPCSPDLRGIKSKLRGTQVFSVDPLEDAVSCDRGPLMKQSVHRNDENIHLKLAGDFDGSSAHELLNTLKSYCRGASRAFIHTSCLKQIHLYGRDVLQSNLDTLNGQCIPLVFTGHDADQLAPEGSKIF